MAGYPIAHAVMMMIPEAWEKHTLMDPKRRAFYEYHAAMMEPWDGPAAIAFTDGRQIGATLDRNGLRPARYFVTDDDLVVMASEAGVLPIPESRIVKKWRLQPGKMFLIDLEQGRIIDDKELKNQLANSKPYREWIEAIRIKLDEIDATSPTSALEEAQFKPRASLLDRQQAFGYTQEDIKFLMTPMAPNGEEATGSMGNDSPLAVLSDKNKPLYNYFKQLFAQVTNPPIDPIREELVMSLVSFIGPQAEPARPQQHQPADPARGDAAGARLRRHGEDPPHRALHRQQVQVAASSTSAIRSPGARKASRRGWRRCAPRPRTRCGSGYNILIVSDRKVDREQRRDSGAAGHQRDPPAPGQPGPAHQHRPGGRDRHRRARCITSRCSPATAPRRSIRTWRWRRSRAMHNDLANEIGPDKAIQNYVKAIGKGLRKVMSKMGISTYMTYTGAQIFEAIGLSSAAGRQVLHRHRRATSRASRCSRSPRRRSACTAPLSATIRCWRTRSMPAASTRSASAARNTCGRRTRSPSCSTPRARQASRPTRNTRRSSTTSPAAT